MFYFNEHGVISVYVDHLNVVCFKGIIQFCVFLEISFNGNIYFSFENQLPIYGFVF